MAGLFLVEGGGGRAEYGSVGKFCKLNGTWLVAVIVCACVDSVCMCVCMYVYIYMHVCMYKST
jgi:hypothetical protein